jgi:predicted neuraminidase
MPKVICSVPIWTWLTATAWSAPAIQGELIFPLQAKHCHSSSIVQCPNGDFLACWFYGSGERNADDVLVQGARLTRGSSTWSPVFLMADTPGFPDCNPVLYVDDHKRLWLFWVSVRTNQWESSILMFRRAEDYDGAGPPKWSWQGVIALKPGDEFCEAIKSGFPQLNYDESMWAAYAPRYSTLLIEASRDKLKRQLGWMGRIHPLTLPTGRTLLPLYSDGFNLSLAAMSDDDGETWRAGKPIVGLGPIQPTFVRRKDGSLVAYMRDAGPPPDRVLMATSSDNGESWSLARDTDIPNPGSSLEVIAIRDGRWVMIFNDTENGRHRLALALSDDEGRTWKWKRTVETAGAGRAGYAYPSLIQAVDARLHATYTFSEGRNSIKHIVVDPEWIAAGNSPP